MLARLLPLAGLLLLVLAFPGCNGCCKPEPVPQPPVVIPDPPKPPAPIADAGLRVLIVEEQHARQDLPAAQLEVLFSTALREHLNSACVKGPDGKTPEWRIFDADTDMENESKLWQDAMKRPRSKLPWLLISNGSAGFEGPLPETVEATVALIKRYEGSK